jgi:energy-coupling factor transporter ATP-binding protein EcfA2
MFASALICKVVLDQATLGISDGDRIGLVGRNGCGKTTFLKILAGLQAPDAGTVNKRRDLVVSYLPQDFTLDPAKNVRENIREGAQPCAGFDCGIRVAAGRFPAARGTGGAHSATGRLDAGPAHRNGGGASELPGRFAADGRFPAARRGGWRCAAPLFRARIS